MSTNENGHYSDPDFTPDERDLAIDRAWERRLKREGVEPGSWADQIPADPWMVEGVDMTPPF